MIGQSNCLLPISIRSFLGKNEEKVCFNLAKHWSVKQIADTFSRSYESFSMITGIRHYNDKTKYQKEGSTDQDIGIGSFSNDNGDGNENVNVTNLHI